MKLAITFYEIGKIVNITYVEVNEIWYKVGTIQLLINQLISSYEGLIGDALGGVTGQNPSKPETLFFINVLVRDYDQADYNYWVGDLNTGVETRYELWLDFSESAKNQSLFSATTGFV